MDSDAFRDAAARWASGVVVVSAPVPGGHRGLTATSFAVVAQEPPLVLVCLDRLATAAEAIGAADRFSISVLSVQQEFLADRFGGRGPAVGLDWTGVSHRSGQGGVAVIEGCVAWFECRPEQRHPAEDHDILVGRVVECGKGAGDPLIYWDRSFWRVS